nr:hypothetical protein [Microseira wollei]
MRIINRRAKPTSRFDYGLKHFTLVKIITEFDGTIVSRFLNNMNR